jgi:hypothetical protein
MRYFTYLNDRSFSFKGVQTDHSDPNANISAFQTEWVRFIIQIWNITLRQ